MKGEKNTKYLIAKQSKTFNRYTNDYVYSDNENKNNRFKKIHKHDYNELTSTFLFTHNKEIDDLLNAAHNRDYNIFKKENSNYRTVLIDSIGYFEVFKIKGFEYFIESNLDNDGELSLTVFNYEYQLKWLKYLSNLKQNYKIDISLDLEKQFLTEAPSEINHTNLKELAKFINNIFHYSVEYHHKPFFEESHTKRESLNMLRTLWSWKHYIDDNVRENRNGVIIKLNELFLNTSTYEFLLIRDYTVFSIDKYIDLTSKLHFQWGYSPYFEEITSLIDAIIKNHPDEKISLKNILKKDFKPNRKKNNEPKKKFSQRQIAIAYFLKKGKTITSENFEDILKKYSNTFSNKILQKRVRKISELTEINGHKTTDTKHLNNLKEAKRLLEVAKDIEAINKITPIIQAFTSNYIAYY